MKTNSKVRIWIINDRIILYNEIINHVSNLIKDYYLFTHNSEWQIYLNKLMLSRCYSFHQIQQISEKKYNFFLINFLIIRFIIFFSNKMKSK